MSIARRSPPVYDDSFFDELREFLPHLEVAFFLGGEPFLATEARRVWDLMIELGLDIPVYAVTNGTQWSDRVEHYLRSLRMGLTVSVDGTTDATTAAIRVGADRPGVMRNVKRYREILEPKGGNVVLNYCLMVDNWHEFREFLAEADRLDLDGRSVTVTDPHEFSLYALDRAALGHVVDEMDSQDHRLPPLVRNKRVWEVELERLRGEFDRIVESPAHSSGRPESAGPVPGGEVVPEGTAVVDGGAWVETTRREMRRSTGADAVFVSIRDEVVREVDATGWAVELLDPASWIGHRELDILDLIVGLRRCRVDVGVTELRPDGSTLVDIVLRRRDPGAVGLALRVARIEQTNGEVSALVARANGPSAAGGQVDGG